MTGIWDRGTGPEYRTIILEVDAVGYLYGAEIGKEIQMLSVGLGYIRGCGERDRNGDVRQEPLAH